MASNNLILDLRGHVTLSQWGAAICMTQQWPWRWFLHWFLHGNPEHKDCWIIKQSEMDLKQHLEGKKEECRALKWHKQCKKTVAAGTLVTWQVTSGLFLTRVLLWHSSYKGRGRRQGMSGRVYKCQTHWGPENLCCSGEEGRETGAAARWKKSRPESYTLFRGT